MPYIAIKGYPKDEETKRKIVERVNEVFLDLWGCPQEAINISVEEIAPERWAEQIEKGEIEANTDKLYIRAGKKLYGSKKLTILHLTGCPYCQKARKALSELENENEAYRAVNVEWIEETEQPERVEAFDYYYVPTLYAGETKIYEANPGDDYETIRANVRKALDACI